MLTTRTWLAVLFLSTFASGSSLAQRPASGPAGNPACGPGSICAEFEGHPLVFVGTVVQTSPDADDRALGPLRPQVVHFQVAEDFKGTSGSSTTLQFDPAADGARIFSIGETVLVYARRDGEGWFAGCSRTRRVTREDSELVTLRQLQALIPGGSIEGTLEVSDNPRPPAPARNVDLGNLPLSAQALDGSGTVSVLSQPGGTFLFSWLRPGAYRIRFESPAFVPVVRDVVVADKSGCLTIAPMSVRRR